MQRCMKYIKKNWLLLAFGILIVGIFANDILAQFVWKTGMAFRPNSIYVFLIDIVFFVGAPIVAIEYIFKDKYYSDWYGKNCTCDWITTRNDGSHIHSEYEIDRKYY